MRPGIMFYGQKGLTMKQTILTQHNIYTVTKYPFARQVPKAIQVGSFISSYPMTRLNGKEDFEGCTFMDICLYWKFILDQIGYCPEVAISLNHIL